jgi:hypothetical protein
VLEQCVEIMCTHFLCSQVLMLGVISFLYLYTCCFTLGQAGFPVLHVYIGLYRFLDEFSGS